MYSAFLIVFYRLAFCRHKWGGWGEGGGIMQQNIFKNINMWLKIANYLFVVVPPHAADGSRSCSTNPGQHKKKAYY